MCHFEQHVFGNNLPQSYAVYDPPASSGLGPMDDLTQFGPAPLYVQKAAMTSKTVTFNATARCVQATGIPRDLDVSYCRDRGRYCLGWS